MKGLDLRSGTAKALMQRMSRKMSDQLFNRMFLLDASGSMHGFKMQEAKKALTANASTSDGIIAFESQYHYVPYEFIDFIFPTGQTAMLPALKRAVEINKASHIILITDGQPNNGGGVLDVIGYVAMLTGVKIDSVGIGRDCDYDFLDQISNMTNGSYYNIDDPLQLTSIVGLLTEGHKQIEL